MSKQMSIERVTKLLQRKASESPVKDATPSIETIQRQIDVYLTRDCYPEAARLVLELPEAQRRERAYTIFRKEATYYEEQARRTKNILLKQFLKWQVTSNRRAVRNML